MGILSTTGKGQRPDRREAQAALVREREAGKVIEFFQLAFLEVAVVELPLADFALKGGGNLRFFFRSRRRSRDLDFDYLGHSFGTFAERLEKRVFTSRALAEILAARGVTLAPPRRAKDTDTVKRWKVALTAAGTEEAPLKIEFSARPAHASAVLAQTGEALARRLRVRATRLNHYEPAATIEQKVGALAGRSETEPRDVFDLDHLFREFPDALGRAQLDQVATKNAIAKAMTLTYEAYEELVLPYLEEEFLPLYGSADAWNDMLRRVTTQLEERL